MNTSRGIGIAPEEQEAIVAGLSRVLADSYTLYLKTHNYHWNVVGPMSTPCTRCSWRSTPSSHSPSTSG